MVVLLHSMKYIHYMLSVLDFKVVINLTTRLFVTCCFVVREVGFPRNGWDKQITDGSHYYLLLLVAHRN